MEKNQFLEVLEKNYPNYITLLGDNQDYILAVPDLNQISEGVRVDETMILEHILE
jgi:hypothetical protein